MHLLKILTEIVKEIPTGHDRKHADTIVDIS